MKNLLASKSAKAVAIALFALLTCLSVYSYAGILTVSFSFGNSRYFADSFLQYFLHIVTPIQSALMPIFIVSALSALAIFIYLMLAAGRQKDIENATLNPFDKVPFDLYLLIAILLFAAALSYMYYLMDIFVFPLIIILIIIMALIFIISAVTTATRLKVGKWWENTIIFKLLLKPICKLLRWIWKKVQLIFNNISLLWKAILVFTVYTILSLAFHSNSIYGNGFAGFLTFILISAALFFICIFILQMQKLKDGASKMAQGNIDYRIDTEKMFPDLAEHGANLNRISEGMSLAVEERMKSEHFRTELITNVSHDLKTPLTSIINYVDLLQKENIKNVKALEYIEVLSRQSFRLKKMTEDLIEASKASTGNIQMEAANTEVNELIAQLMGEYEEKFAAANLEVITNIPEEKYSIFVDGRLIWRIFDNLFNNTFKYSQPHTRVFIDIGANREKVWINMKNTSSQLLNISAEDLMERFVRGDSSRNNEGSGLGLSIARSLTELQHGKLELSVDGDLFKVKISFDRIYN